MSARRVRGYLKCLACASWMINNRQRHRSVRGKYVLDIVCLKMLLPQSVGGIFLNVLFDVLKYIVPFWSLWGSCMCEPALGKLITVSRQHANCMNVFLLCLSNRDFRRVWLEWRLSKNSFFVIRGTNYRLNYFQASVGFVFVIFRSFPWVKNTKRWVISLFPPGYCGKYMFPQRNKKLLISDSLFL